MRFLKIKDYKCHRVIIKWATQNIGNNIDFNPKTK